MKKLALFLALLCSPAFAQNPGVTTQGPVTAGNCVKFVNRNMIADNGAACAGATSFANPTASVGLTAVNGSATTAMRSDAAPALDQTAAYAFTGLGATTIADATQSTSTTTGALKIAGGLGVVKNVNFGGTLTITGQLLAASGTAANPGMSFSAGNNYGMFYATNLLGWSVGGTQRAEVGASYFAVPQTSSFAWGTFGVSLNTQLTSPNNNIVQLGPTAAASPTAYILQAQGSRPGTDSNVGGATLTITTGNGTGTGTLATLTLQSPIAVASGTGAQTQTTGWRINNGTAASTGYTVATLPAVSLTGARAHVTDQLTTCAAVGAALLGVGAVICPVFYNGTTWVGG